MEEFLVFGQTIADPWNRVSPMQKPLLLIVEFCQIQGPRPLLWHPEDDVCSAHLLEEIAVWLMSSENMHGNYSVLYNQQMGLFVLVQYATMIDITARALQRPFAVALVLSSQPNFEQIVNFQQIATNMLLPLLACNRCYINTVLDYAAQMVRNTDLTNFRSYYSTSGNAQEIIILSDRIKRIVHQLKPWYSQFLVKIYMTEGVENVNLCSCECGDEDFRRYLQILGRKQATELVDLMELCPCVGRNFAISLENAYKHCANSSKVSEGLMFSGNMPVIRSLFGANSQQDDDLSSEGTSHSANDYDLICSTYHMGAENTLKSLSFRLARCIYPLLAGDKICFAASKQRIVTGIDLMRKLNRLRVCKRFERVDWSFEQNRFDENIEHQLTGISCDREKAYSLSEKAADHGFVVIDLNNHRIRCREYSGKLLVSLNGNRTFPSDNATMDFIVSTITDIFQLLLLAKYISPELVVRQFQLSIPDQTILYNFLIEFNLTKYIRLKSKALEFQSKIPFVMQRF